MMSFSHVSASLDSALSSLPPSGPPTKEAKEAFPLALTCLRLEPLPGQAVATTGSENLLSPLQCGPQEISERWNLRRRAMEVVAAVAARLEQVRDWISHL